MSLNGLLLEHQERLFFYPLKEKSATPTNWTVPLFTHAEEINDSEEDMDREVALFTYADKYTLSSVSMDQWRSVFKLELLSENSS